MARKPEVFVQPLEPEQAQRLVKIAEMFAATEGYVREVIHAFNDNGFAALDPKWSGGPPRKFGPAARELICQTARSSPSALGQGGV